MRVGACDPTTNTSFYGKDIYGRFNINDFILWPVAISPHGKWGTIMHHHLTGKEDVIIINSLPHARRRRKCTAAACPTQRRLKSTTSYGYLAGKKVQAAIFLWSFLHMPHSKGIRFSRYWSCDFECSYYSHPRCKRGKTGGTK